MGSMTEINGVTVYRADPAGEPRGAVIVIHEIWGLVDQIKRIADRWAAEGYLAVAPDILSHGGVTPEVGLELQQAIASPDEAVRTAMQPKLREKLAPVREPGYAAWAVGQLKALVDGLVDEGGDDARIAVTGYCFGGTYSFALAADDDRVLVAAPFYGTAPEPAKIADIRCPVLAFYGEIDPPLMERLPEVREEMAKAGIDFTDVVYPGAHHGFFNETNSRTYDVEAAEDAWAKVTAFVDEHVG